MSKGAGWMRAILVAAVYNVLWGGGVVLFPFALFRVLGMELPNCAQIWQCIGMFVGVCGVGYARSRSTLCVTGL